VSSLREQRLDVCDKLLKQRPPGDVDDIKARRQLARRGEVRAQIATSSTSSLRSDLVRWARSLLDPFRHRVAFGEQLSLQRVDSGYAPSSGFG
jgi:hypothetical protein